MDIKGSDIEDTPEFGTILNTDYIPGMARTAGSEYFRISTRRSAATILNLADRAA
jgi:hypothetical protein